MVVTRKGNPYTSTENRLLSSSSLLKTTKPLKKPLDSYAPADNLETFSSKVRKLASHGETSSPLFSLTSPKLQSKKFGSTKMTLNLSSSLLPSKSTDLSVKPLPPISSARGQSAHAMVPSMGNKDSSPCRTDMCLFEAASVNQVDESTENMFADFWASCDKPSDWNVKTFTSWRRRAAKSTDIVVSLVCLLAPVVLSCE